MKQLIARHPYAVLLVGILLVLGAAALAFTADVPSGRHVSSSSAAVPVGPEGLDEAPDFALERLNGETFRLSDHRGKVVALNFWATWCPPCREEIPDLVALQEEMKGDVLFVGVSLDKGSPDSVRAFAEEFGINYPIVIDDGTVLEKYGPIFGIPTTFFTGRKGRVQLVAAGMLTEEGLRPVLTVLAEGKVPETLEPPLRRPR